MSEPLKIRRIKAFTGPNLVAPWPCASVILTVAPPSFSIQTLGRIAQAAESVLPDMPAPDGSGQNTVMQRAIGELIGRLAIGLQSTVFPCHARIRTETAGGDVHLVFSLADPRAAAVAASAAVNWVNASIDDHTPVDASTLQPDFARRLGYPPILMEQRQILEEAARRGIPRLAIASALRLGWGASQRWLGRLMTERTPAFSVQWATHKPTTAELLAAAGIPVPEHHQAATQADAIRIADRIGYPVVMKPASSDRGIGVRLGLSDARAVAQAFPAVRALGMVIVQRQHPGADHRLMVINGRLIAAARRIPAQVIGDGVRTVRALIDEVNRDPRRGEHHTTVLERIRTDEETMRVLAEQGLDLDAVPTFGREVTLRLTANLSTGGTSEDVTDRIHPDNRALAERTARIVGLDITGIDFLSPDISRSHLEVGGVICEVNPNPGFRPHLAAPGSPDVARAIIDAMFPEGDDGRIPAAVITGTVGKTTTCRMVASILRAAGHTVGLATTDGVQIDDARVHVGDEAGPRGAGMVFADRSVTAAVLEAARGGLLQWGVGPERYQVGAMLNVGADHVGTDGVNSIDELARVKSLVLAGATRAWVLNADDPRCLAMARRAGQREVILVGRDANAAPLAAHLAAGGRAVALVGEGGTARVVGLRGKDTLVSVAVHSIPATYGGIAEFNVDNARYATAIALGLGAPAEAITAGLQRFTPDARWSPTRANLHAIGPLRVLIDFAHNAESFEAIGRMAMRLEVAGRRLLLLDAPGNRADAAYLEMASAVAERFDHFICSTSVPRERPTGEVSRLLAQALRERGVSPDRIETVEPFTEAIGRIFGAARAGDLLVIPADNPDEVLKHPACLAWVTQGSRPG